LLTKDSLDNGKNLHDELRDEGTKERETK